MGSRFRDLEETSLHDASLDLGLSCFFTVRKGGSLIGRTAIVFVSLRPAVLSH